MNAISLILLFCAVTNLILALYVFARRGDKAYHKVFPVFVAVLALWNFDHVAILLLDDPFWIHWLGRLAYVLAVVIVTLYLVFTWVFPENNRLMPSRRGICAVVFCSIVVAGIALTPWMQEGVKLDQAGLYSPVRGPFHPFFGMYTTVLFLWGSANLLISRWRAPPGRQRMQLNYSITGFIPSFVVVFVTQFLIPVIHPEIRFLSLASPLVWTLLTSYAILRYRLMDIGIALRSTAIHGIMAVVLWLFFLIPFAAYPHIAPHVSELIGTVLLLLLAIVLAFVVAPLHEKTRRIVDQYLFHGRYDHEAAVLHFGQALSGNYSRESIAGVVVSEMPILFRTINCAVYLATESGGAYRRAASHCAESERDVPLPAALDSDDPLVQALVDTRDLIHLDDLGKLPSRWHRKREQLERSLHDLHALCVLPLLSSSRTHGVVVMGERADDNMYTTQELQLVRTLAGHAALALDNAALFDEQVAAKRHYETILRHMQRGVLSVHADLRIRTLNLCGARILGLTAGEWIGEPVGDLHPFFETVLVQTMDEQSNLALREQPLEWRGRTFPCECETSLLRDRKGNVSGAALVFQDLTDRKEFEAEVRRVDRLASVGTLAAGLAHEIKNPLVAIQTFAQLLPERYEQQQFRDQFTSVVIGEVGRINSLVQNMLDLARPRNEIPAEVQIHDVLEQVLTLLGNQFRTYDIAVSTHLDGGVPPIVCSVQQMHQVFLNLVQNAVEAMEDAGGELIIATALDNGHAPPEPESRPPMVRITVRDTGAGMTEQQTQRIFDPFYSTKANGSGLGLSNCLSILREQGASITIDSTPGKGSVFTVLLPLMPPSDNGCEINEPSAS